MTDFEQRRADVVNVRLLGAPARSCAAWLSAIDRAERAGESCPTWADLEAIAPSLPIDETVVRSWSPRSQSVS